MHPIIYNNPERSEYVRGVAVPVFIHNGRFYLSTLDIYEDGVADCWELIPIADLQDSITQGWIVSEPPQGAEISIHNLGDVRAADAQWRFPQQTIAQKASDIFRQLNPEKRNLLDLNKRRKQIALEENLPETQIWQTRLHAARSLYRLNSAGQVMLGAEVPVFQPQNGEFLLTRCFVYQDQQARLGDNGELLPLETIHTLLQDQSLLTAVPDDVWVTLPELGRFRAVEGMWPITQEERWRELVDLAAALSGQSSAVETCYQAFQAYQAAPTDANREKLRAVYEAVPEHQRLYTQRSMDDKDHDIRQILYGRENKTAL